MPRRPRLRTTPRALKSLPSTTTPGRCCRNVMAIALATFFPIQEAMIFGSFSHVWRFAARESSLLLRSDKGGQRHIPPPLRQSADWVPMTRTTRSTTVSHRVPLPFAAKQDQQTSSYGYLPCSQFPGQYDPHLACFHRLAQDV